MLPFPERCRGWRESHLSLAVLLAFCVVYFSSQNCFARDQSRQPPRADNDKPRKSDAERPPFDLTYVPPYATGVLAIRPNTIFHDPAMRPLARMANEALTGLLPISIPADLRLPIEEIEQVIGFMMIHPNQGAAKGTHSSGMVPLMIRAAGDYDWLRLMRRLDPKLEKVHREGQTYYKLTLKSSTGKGKGAIIWCVVPDKRTLVLVPPADGIALVTGKPLPRGQLGHRANFAWDKHWKQVERGIIAVALDNRWASGLSPKQIGGEPWANVLTQHVSTMVAGVDWKDGIDFHAYLNCKDAAAAKQAINVIKSLLAGMAEFREATLSAQSASGPSPPAATVESEEIEPSALPPEIALQMTVWKDLVKHAQVTQHDSTALVHTTARLRFGDLVKMIQFYVIQFHADQEYKDKR